MPTKWFLPQSQWFVNKLNQQTIKILLILFCFSKKSIWSYWDNQFDESSLAKTSWPDSYAFRSARFRQHSSHDVLIRLDVESSWLKRKITMALWRVLHWQRDGNFCTRLSRAWPLTFLGDENNSVCSILILCAQLIKVTKRKQIEWNVVDVMLYLKILRHKKRTRERES